MCRTLQSEFKKFSLIFNIFELSIGILNNRNSWIEQIFRLAQQFMIKRWKRGRGIIPRTNISLSKYESALKRRSSQQKFVTFTQSPLVVSWLWEEKGKKYRTPQLDLLHEVAAGLASQFQRKFWVFCRFFPARPEKNRHQVDALVHLWPVCQPPVDRGLILFEAQQMQPYREP